MEMAQKRRVSGWNEWKRWHKNGKRLNEWKWGCQKHTQELHKKLTFKWEEMAGLKWNQIIIERVSGYGEGGYWEKAF